MAEYKAKSNQGLQWFTYQEVNRSNHWTRSGSRPAHHPTWDFSVKSSSLHYQSARPARLMQAPFSRLGRRHQVFNPVKSLGVATEKVQTVSPDCPALPVLPSPRRSPPGCCELSRGYSRGAYLLWKPGPPSHTNPHPKLRLDLPWFRGTWFKSCSVSYREVHSAALCEKDNEK